MARQDPIFRERQRRLRLAYRPDRRLSMAAGALRAPRRARASVLVRVPGLRGLLALQSPPSGAREEPLARVEGPPESGVTLRRLRGRAEGAGRRRRGLEGRRARRAFDAWRRAIVASHAPDAVGGGRRRAAAGSVGDDVDGTLARRAEDWPRGVIRRLAQRRATRTAPRGASASSRWPRELERVAAGNRA